MNSVFARLVQREFWEHRSLWMAPLIGAGVLVVLAVLGAVLHDGAFQIGPPGRGLPAELARIGPRMIAVYALSMQLFAVAALVAAVYLTDCLFAERKDRSILFWKSLPVSDTRTVLAKLFVALVVVPAGTFLLALVTVPLVFGIMALGMPQVGSMLGEWQFSQWLQAEGALLGSLGVSLLWYAPLAVWLMLASVFSRRAPLMLATLPWVALGISESVALRSTHVWHFIGMRLSPVGDALDALSRPQLWLGLAAAAGMLYMVIRLRRYRDDT